jgi:hypothetical protein
MLGRSPSFLNDTKYLILSEIVSKEIHQHYEVLILIGLVSHLLHNFDSSIILRLF